MSIVSKKFVVGWASRAANLHLLAEPQSPANWKDPVKIPEYVREKEAKRLADAALMPIVGEVDEILILDQTADVVFHERRLTNPDIALEFTNFVAMHETYGGGDLYIPDEEISTKFFGLNARPLFRITALEVMSKYEKVKLPPRSWHNVPGVYDPYEMLVQSDQRRDIAITALCEHLNIEPGFNSAHARARTAYALCERAGLLERWLPTSAAASPSPRSKLLGLLSFERTA